MGDLVERHSTSCAAIRESSRLGVTQRSLRWERKDALAPKIGRRLVVPQFANSYVREQDEIAAHQGRTSGESTGGRLLDFYEVNSKYILTTSRLSARIGEPSDDRARGAWPH